MSPLLSADIVTRYEVLRDHLVQGRLSHASNWRLVMAYGLLAWSQLPPSHSTPVPPPPPVSGGVPEALQWPVAQVLASMVLSLHREVMHEV
jgi:hypothetical protein